ncbi:MAG: hypothetical protein L6Q57_07310 [Alphaproteobacteria bacterium]|nr:hypothetical protein [Alphaproteobacteria bacterium]
MTQKRAILDIGSNSVRMVVFDSPQATGKPSFNVKVACGLGRDLDKTGKLHPEGVILALEAIQGFHTLARAMKIKTIIAIGTAALREAKDAKDFVRRVQTMTKIKIRVISGEEEARFSAFGVLRALPKAKGIVGDLGGGSLELARIEKGNVHEVVSLPLGVLRVKGDATFLLRPLSFLPRELTNEKTFYAVGGTWRALAAAWLISRDRKGERLHGVKIERADMISFCQKIMKMKPKALIKTYGVEDDRAPYLPAAARVMVEVLAATGCKQVVFSTTSLRDGILVSSQ